MPYELVSCDSSTCGGGGDRCALRDSRYGIQKPQWASQALRGLESTSGGLRNTHTHITHRELKA